MKVSVGTLMECILGGAAFGVCDEKRKEFHATCIELSSRIEELERKAALWDKLSALPDGSEIQREDPNRKIQRWSIRAHVFANSNTCLVFANTLEEALNQIPEVRS